MFKYFTLSVMKKGILVLSKEVIIFWVKEGNGWVITSQSILAQKKVEKKNKTLMHKKLKRKILSVQQIFITEKLPTSSLEKKNKNKNNN